VLLLLKINNTATRMTRTRQILEGETGKPFKLYRKANGELSTIELTTNERLPQYNWRKTVMA
jgi:hypothetical protein